MATDCQAWLNTHYPNADTLTKNMIFEMTFDSLLYHKYTYTPIKNAIVKNTKFSDATIDSIFADHYQSSINFATFNGQTIDRLQFIACATECFYQELQSDTRYNIHDTDVFKTVNELWEQEALGTRDIDVIIDFLYDQKNTNLNLTDAGKNLIRFYREDVQFWYVDHPELVYKEGWNYFLDQTGLYKNLPREAALFLMPNNGLQADARAYSAYLRNHGYPTNSQSINDIITSNGKTHAEMASRMWDGGAWLLFCTKFGMNLANGLIH